MEDKDIKIIKDLINDLKQQETITGYNAEIEIQTLEKLLQAYKQDEKIIQEMAEFIYGNDTIFYLPKDVNTKQEVIDYFRKRCNNE